MHCRTPFGAVRRVGRRVTSLGNSIQWPHFDNPADSVERGTPLLQAATLPRCLSVSSIAYVR